jgi:hypothetical protein
MLLRIRTCPRLAAAMKAAVLGLGVLALSACDRRPETKRPPDPAETSSPAQVLTPPLPPPPVSRAELLQAIDAARSAYAAGQAAADGELAGRRFAVRQAFGCRGASASETVVDPGVSAGVASWAWGREQQTIEISLTPADWTGATVLTGEGKLWEAVEGYWLTRPWLRTDGCPAGAASPADADGMTPPDPDASAGHATLISGLAAVFEQGGSRVGRRDGKAFTLVLRGDLPPAARATGYRLVLEGRFSKFPDGRAIRCHSPSVDQAPVCVAAAKVDRIAFEDADGKLLKRGQPYVDTPA